MFRQPVCPPRLPAWPAPRGLLGASQLLRPQCSPFSSQSDWWGDSMAPPPDLARTPLSHCPTPHWLQNRDSAWPAWCLPEAPPTTPLRRACPRGSGSRTGDRPRESRVSGGPPPCAWLLHTHRPALLGTDTNHFWDESCARDSPLDTVLALPSSPLSASCVLPDAASCLHLLLSSR